MCGCRALRLGKQREASLGRKVEELNEDCEAFRVRHAATLVHRFPSPLCDVGPDAPVCASQARVERLEDDKTNMLLELKGETRNSFCLTHCSHGARTQEGWVYGSACAAGRPTIKAWKASQRRVEELEQQLYKAVEEAR
jgi:hypothetical protein